MVSTDDVPLGRGAVAGVGAWLLGYLVTYVWQSGEVMDQLEGIGFISNLLGGDPIPAWKGVTWFFLNAHYVDTQFPTVAGGTRMVNFVTGEGGGPMALVVLPPLLLAVAGLLAAYGESADVADGAKAGVTVVLGYLPLSLLAAFLTSHRIGDTEAAVAADPVTAILLAGVVYPLVFGAVGGAIASQVGASGGSRASRTR